MKNLKKFGALLLALVMMLSLSVTAFAAGTEGTIEPITEVGVVSGSDISVSNSSLQWFPKDTTVGRYSDGWWVGVKITAPADYAQDNNAMYSSDKGTTWKSFNTNKDGEWYMGCWLPVQPQYLTGAIGANSVLQWTYQFDWNTTDANGTYTADQTFKITVDPNNITLNKDGQVYFQTENGKVIVDERVSAPAEGVTTGSITMNNAVVGETYKLYKVFDLSFDAESGAVSYTYSKNGQTDTFLDALLGNDSPFALTETSGLPGTYTVALKEGKTAADVSAFLKTNQSSLTADTAATKAGLDTDDKATATTISWSGLAYGYYFVDSSLGSLITVNSTLPNVTVQEKNAIPSIVKEVMEDDDSSYGEKAVLDVIDTVNYKLTVNTGKNAANLGTGVDGDYEIVDTLPSGFAYDSTEGAVAVKVGEGTPWMVDKDYTVTYTDATETTQATLKIVLKSDGALKDLAQNTDITITYAATMTNSKVAIGGTGNVNSVVLTYKAQESKDNATVYTYQIGGTATGDKPMIQKIDGTTNEALAGVKFILSKKVDDTTYYAKVSEKTEGTAGSYYLTEWATTEADAGAIVTGTNGGIEVLGLDAGTYVLTETEALPGYNMLTDTITAVIAADGTVTYKMTSATGEGSAEPITIINNTGTELPSTGGMGTTIFYVVGAVLVLGAAILLVTKRRMNAAK